MVRIERCLHTISRTYNAVMDSQLDEEVNCTVTVKNTFVDLVELKVESRRSSVPASSRLCRKDIRPSLCPGEGILNVDNINDDSTTDASALSESGSRTPMSMDDSSPKSPPSPFCSSIQPPPSSFAPAVSFAQAVPCAQAVPPPPTPIHGRRLNAQAVAFQPKTLPQPKDPNKERYKSDFGKVLQLAKAAIQDSEHVTNVELSQDANGWSIVIQPTGNSEENLTEILMTLVKEALLGATSKSKTIYVMGYAEKTKAFNVRAQGFEATLGAMRSASSACWHVFKKGFCRHGKDCSKQHAACQVPVHVLVEGAQLDSNPRFASEFKQVVDNLALTVTSSLQASPYLEVVRAFQHRDQKGWTIEMTANEELTQDKEEYLLTLAKNALLGANSNAPNVYIMGLAAKPFTFKSHGFVTMIGDMQDEAKVCWDLYSRGSCSRSACDCRWGHPKCLMPINVLVKGKSSCNNVPLRLHTAMQQHCGGSGHGFVTRR